MSPTPRDPRTTPHPDQTDDSDAPAGADGKDDFADDALATPCELVELPCDRCAGLAPTSVASQPAQSAGGGAGRCPACGGLGVRTVFVYAPTPLEVLRSTDTRAYLRALSRAYRE